MHVKRKDRRTTATFLGLIFCVTEPRPQSYKHKTKHYFIFKNGESPFIHFLKFPLSTGTSSLLFLRNGSGNFFLFLSKQKVKFPSLQSDLVIGT